MLGDWSSLQELFARKDKWRRDNLAQLQGQLALQGAALMAKCRETAQDWLARQPNSGLNSRYLRGAEARALPSP